MSARRGGGGSDGATEATTLERIRREARALFARRGYGGASIAEIASRVGIQKASLYNYFASKADLLLELFDDSLERWTEAAEPALNGPGTFEERLRNHLLAEVQFAATHPQRTAIIRIAAIQLSGDLGHRVKERLDWHEERYMERMMAFFDEAIEAGAIEPADPQDLQALFGGFLDGLMSRITFVPDSAPQVLEQLPRLWSYLWRGLSGRPTEIDLPGTTDE